MDRTTVSDCDTNNSLLTYNFRKYYEYIVNVGIQQLFTIPFKIFIMQTE